MTSREEHNHSTQQVVGGMVIGTLIGAAAAFLLVSKSGKQFAQGIADAYHHVNDRAHDLSQNIAEKASHHLSGHFFAKTPSSNHHHLLIGAVAGGVLGIAATLYLSGQCSGDLCKKISKTLDTLSEKTQEIGENIQDRTHDTIENLEERLSTWIAAAQKLANSFNAAKKNARPSSREGTLNNVVDWASLGIRLFQSLKK